MIGGFMLNFSTDLVFGIFDSNVNMKKAPRTDERTVQCHELEFFPEDGKACYIDGSEHIVKRGMILCAKPGQKRFSVLPMKCYYIRLFNKDCREAAILDSFPSCTYAAPEKADFLGGLFLKLGACFIGNTTGISKELHLHSLYYEILYECDKIISPESLLIVSEANADIPVLKAKDYLDAHFRESCTLETLSEKVHLSPNYLHTLFRERLGKTPLDYLTDKRIENAKRLILSGEYSLLEIALDSGFCSQSHFNKVFRQKTGFTPAQYRRDLTSKY